MNELRIISALIFASSALNALAIPVTLKFSGHLSSAYGTLPYGNGSASVGDPFTVSMTWDTSWDGVTLPYYDPDSPIDFFYPYVILQIKGFGGGLSPVQGGGGGQASIFTYNTSVYDSITFGGEFSNEENIWGLVTLISSNGKGITDSGLSQNPSDWTGGYFGMQDINGGGDPARFSASGTIPDSSNTSTLLGLGIVGLFMGSRISSRKTA